MSCAVPECVAHPWGHVGRFKVPHAPTELKPFTSRCLEKCKCGRACAKANGHEWSCYCHMGKEFCK